MKKVAFCVLIIGCYCFPFVYFAMYKDFESRSMIGYGIMILVTSILAFFGKLSNNTPAIIIGNMVSAIVSYYFISSMEGNGSWQGYFKPLTPLQLSILVTFINGIPQLLAMKVANRLRNKRIS